MSRRRSHNVLITRCQGDAHDFVWQALEEAEARLAELDARHQQLLKAEKAAEERLNAVTRDADATVLCTSCRLCHRRTACKGWSAPPPHGS